MKKVISLLLCVSLLACTMTGCAHSSNINGKTVVPYGIMNSNDKDPNVQYQVSVGNVFWAIVLMEFVFPPVIIFGWFVYEPIGAKK
jgi:ABC-type oligopeptide transport system substrate-binding subunit